ncbi:hypothetical protein BDV96DRAFT_647534 [Lophiotrema nucula]|uniref:Uncharacterized protein n=1 Tax=Lophiotrema nucula TaxID=690887 RepID=A0A6A5Z4M8_9PLEO|nr:hypothetical protein BDV96DRAFT_647534 [Lophiotrema nucula]
MKRTSEVVYKSKTSPRTKTLKFGAFAMKLSTYLLAALGLLTSASAAPMTKKSTIVEHTHVDIEAREPLGQFISNWYGEDEPPAGPNAEDAY